MVGRAFIPGCRSDTPEGEGEGRRPEQEEAFFFSLKPDFFFFFFFGCVGSSFLCEGFL